MAARDPKEEVASVPLPLPLPSTQGGRDPPRLRERKRTLVRLGFEDQALLGRQEAGREYGAPSSFNPTSPEPQLKPGKKRQRTGSSLQRPLTKEEIEKIRCVENVT